jgi:antitoxin component YwqK of YwqJK toxin-antitoxin module
LGWYENGKKKYEKFYKYGRLESVPDCWDEYGDEIDDDSC